MPLDLKQALQFSQEIIVKAGAQLLAIQSDTNTISYKDRGDIVSNADLEVEKLLIDAIRQLFPNHGIYSEERGVINAESEFTWFIDPIDGSKEFVRHTSNYSICLSLQSAVEILVSCVYVPRTKELYSATSDAGAFESSQRVHVSQETKLENSFVLLHAPSHKISTLKRKKYWDTVARIDESSYKTFVRLNDNIMLSELAKGGYDGYVHLTTETTPWWDVSPGLHIAHEAGATVTDTLGNKIKNRHIENGLVISNGQIHQQLLEVINNKKSKI